MSVPGLAKKPKKDGPSTVYARSSFAATANTAVKNPTLARISKKLTMVELKEEAECRGLEKKTLPKTKADLLAHLVEGSIYLKKTDAWKQVEALKEQMEREKDDLLVHARVAQRLEDEKRQERQCKKEEKERAEREKQRMLELTQQRSLHKHYFPLVHGHPLARSSELMHHTNSRCYSHVSCETCECFTTPLYTCESCDFDICSRCFQRANMSKKELTALEAKEQKEAKARHRAEEKHQEQLRKQEEKEEKERIARWDATKQFKKSIVNPPDKNKVPTGNKMIGFTVWCATGYQDDGFHSGNGPLIYEFESTWKSAEDANARARYMFYWKNCWGIYPDEMEETGESTEEWEQDGFKHFTYIAGDSCEWSVGVVPDLAFRHMPYSSMGRATYDDGQPPKGSITLSRSYASYRDDGTPLYGGTR